MHAHMDWVLVYTERVGDSRPLPGPRHRLVNHPTGKRDQRFLTLKSRTKALPTGEHPSPPQPSPYPCPSLYLALSTGWCSAQCSKRDKALDKDVSVIRSKIPMWPAMRWNLTLAFCTRRRLPVLWRHDRTSTCEPADTHPCLSAVNAV